MEETRVAFMDSIGYSFRKMEQTGIASPVVGITVDYKKPVEFDDDVEVRLSILKYSGAVLELGYEFFNVTKGEVCTTAMSKHCFVKDGRIVSLKKVLPEFDGILASYNA
jgi:acyl-CoA thioester hydrolase